MVVDLNGHYVLKVESALCPHLKGVTTHKVKTTCNNDSVIKENLL